ncbi:MAG: hypothetical protein IPO92_13985, partial [Saprospiraceae bacterium]|nr:hypothetical protein [Saprospiraceae bacterium]
MNLLHYVQEHMVLVMVAISREIGPVGLECSLDWIRFKDGAQPASMIPVMNGVLTNFKPLEGLNTSTVTSNNTCLCSTGVQALENSFSQGEVNLWVHQFFTTSVQKKGILFVKGRMPSEPELPIIAQKEHLTSIHIHNTILAQNTTTAEQGRVIFSNIFMPHPIGV